MYSDREINVSVQMQDHRESSLLMFPSCEVFGDRLVPAASATTVVRREHQLIVGRLSSRAGYD
jgi:hypothetical protein